MSSSSLGPRDPNQFQDNNSVLASQQLQQQPLADNKRASNSHSKVDTNVNAFATKNGVKIKKEDASGNVLQRLKNKLTSVKVNDNGNTQNLNIGSLSKKTNTSILKIFAKRLNGSLDTAYVNKRENINSIIGSVRKEAKENDIKPKQAEKKIREAIKTAQKIDVQANKTLFSNVRIGTSSYTLKISADKSIQVLRAVEEKDGNALGQGSFGVVKSVQNVATGKMTTLVQKEARPQDATDIAVAKEQLRNENTILTVIDNKLREQGKESIGLPKPPHSIFEIQGQKTASKDMSIEGLLLKNMDTEGLLLERFDYDLSSKDFLKQPFDDKLKQSFLLVEGLSTLHELGITHGDIKPENCSSKEGALRLEDFGGARQEKDLSLNNAVGAYTESYTKDLSKDLSKLPGNATKQDISKAVKAHDVFSLGMTILATLGEGDKINENGMMIQRDFFIKINIKVVEEKNPLMAELLSDMLLSSADRPTIEAVKSRYKAILEGKPLPAAPPLPPKPQAEPAAPPPFQEQDEY